MFSEGGGGVGGRQMKCKLTQELQECKVQTMVCVWGEGGGDDTFQVIASASNCCAQKITAYRLVAPSHLLIGDLPVFSTPRPPTTTTTPIPPPPCPPAAHHPLCYCNERHHRLLCATCLAGITLEVIQRHHVNPHPHSHTPCQPPPPPLTCNE
jgi:hypothetical protein